MAAALDFICEVFFYASGVVPFVVLVYCLISRRQLPIGRRIAVAALYATSVFVFLGGSWFLVTLRDGLGPGTVESTGWCALKKASFGVFIPMIFASLFLLPALLLSKSRHEKTA